MPIRIKAKKKITEGHWAGVTAEDGYRLVPCGKCIACRQRRVNDWVIRLMAEDRAYLGGVFVTLTYDPKHVPMTQKGFMTVTKRDVQLFLKRLRKNTGKKIKYYCAAEYGSKTYRPHYHLIMFGCNMEEINEAWAIGDIHVGSVSGDSCGYTLKYISKEKQIPMFNGDDRTPEFSLMSKNLGLCYLTPEIKKYHVKNNISYFAKEGGYMAALPRYYRDRIFSQEQKDLINLELQQKHVIAHERAIEAAGSVTNFYRLQGEFAREQMRILKNKHKTETKNKI